MEKIRELLAQWLREMEQAEDHTPKGKKGGSSWNKTTPKQIKPSPLLLTEKP